MAQGSPVSRVEHSEPRIYAIAWLALSLAIANVGCGDDAADDTTQAAKQDANQDASAAAHQDASQDADVAQLEPPTWHQDIAPIVSEKCSGCHQDGGIAPFSVERYEDAKIWALAMADAVTQGRMPPFLAQDTDECKPRLPWVNDLRLSAAEKALMRAWAEADAPEGDADHAAALSQPPVGELPREDVVMRLPEPITVEGNKDIHMCVIVDPQLDEDAYVIGRQLTAGNKQVLHHVVSYVIAPGTNDDGTTRTKQQLEAKLKNDTGVGIGGSYPCFGGPGLSPLMIDMLDAWAPGGVPNLAPVDSGQFVAKDSLVMLDVHYHPIGTPQTDSDTRLSLMLADDKPKYVSRIALLGNFSGPLDTIIGRGDLVVQEGEDAPEFMIPPGAKNHYEEMLWTWKLPPGIELRVFGVGTHMHYVGRDEKVSIERAARAVPDDGEPREECLVQTPAWDFNWQSGYGYAAAIEDLPVMRNGDTLRIRCRYDNSMDNRFVRAALADRGLDAPIEVRLGEDTLDEMCLAGIGIIYPNL